MDEIISYVQYAISRNSMTDKRKRRSGDVFDNSRRSYKYLSAILVYNALSGSTNLQATLLRVLSDPSTCLKLNREIDLLLSAIVKHFRVSKDALSAVGSYRSYLEGLLATPARNAG